MGRGGGRAAGGYPSVDYTASHPGRVTQTGRRVQRRWCCLSALRLTSCGFLLLTETAINIGYSCHLLTDDMTEVFIINGETLESVQQAIAEYKNKILSATSTKPSKENSLRDVDVEVLSYKSYKDTPAGEIPTSTQVITTSVCTCRVDIATWPANIFACSRLVKRRH